MCATSSECPSSNQRLSEVRPTSRATSATSRTTTAAARIPVRLRRPSPRHAPRVRLRRSRRRRADRTHPAASGHSSAAEPSTGTLAGVETLFDLACRDRVLERIERLRPDARREWGKMDAAQAMAHCALALEASTGDAALSRPLFARLLGPFFKGFMLGPKPFSKNSPTHPRLVTTSPKDFERERARLVATIRKFHDAGPASAARFEHAFVGKLSGDEWGRLQHKHVDHHLRRFGA